MTEEPREEEATDSDAAGENHGPRRGGKSRIRAFVALDLPAPLREELAEVSGCLRPLLPGVGWVTPERMHLTLKFLGELEQGRLDHLSRSLRKAAVLVAPFELELQGLGFFPPRGPARVLWAGCQGDLDSLRALVQGIEAQARRIRIPKERRPFRAHLTLGRIRSLLPARQVEQALEGLDSGRSFGSFEVRDFVLMRSVLGPGGPTYTPIERYQLVG